LWALNKKEIGFVMTKKQYFMLLWALSSMVSILSVVQYGFNCMGYKGMSCLIFSPLFAIAMHGCALVFGIYFAQKISARLLFLDGQYNFMKDILKPAAIAGTLYAGAALIINALTPSFYAVQRFSAEEPFFLFFYKLFYDIRFDLFGLLFCVSGLAFIIKKLTKNISMSVVMSTAVGLIIAVPLLYDCYRALLGNFSWLGVAQDLYGIGTIALIMALFWRKGLEAALLCRVVIVTILYLIAPTVILLVGA